MEKQLEHDQDRTATLRRLAAALAERPQATTAEIAEAAGLSRASLNRIFGSKADIEEQLLGLASAAVEGIVRVAREPHEDYAAALADLLEAHYAEYDAFRWLTTQDASAIEGRCNPDYFPSMDAFFLAGQKAGAFRIDFPAAFLTTVFMYGACGLIDAERQGRVARAGAGEAYLDFFLRGAGQDDAGRDDAEGARK